MTGPATRRKRWGATVVVAALLGAGPTAWAAQTDTTSAIPPSRSARPLEYQIGDAITLFGEIAFRLEYFSNEFFAENDATVDDDHRFRERVRLRFGAEFAPTELFVAGFRFSTGSPDYPPSGWSSFSDQFRRDAVFLDRLYVNLNVGQFQLRMGGNANPLFRPTELVWDDDVQVGGLAQLFQAGKWRFAFGQYMLNEARSIDDPEGSGSFLFANNVTFSPEFGDRFTVGVFHYYYNKPNAIAIAIDAGNLNADFMTNRLAPNNDRRFFSGYNSLGGSLLWRNGPWRIAGEFVWNMAAKSDPSLGAAYEKREDVGFGVLFRYGVLSEPWDWSLEGGFFRIEADATIAAFNSDDIQQTNVNGIPIWVRLRLPGEANLVWDTYFQKRINTELFLAGGLLHPENALKVRTRLTISLGF